MMAQGHAVSGLVAGLASVTVVQHQPVAVQAAWVAVWMGFALAPDWDSPGTKVARMWGPVSGGFRPRIWGRRRRLVPGIVDVIGTMAGGHRKGTHSIVGLVLSLFAVWVASWSRIGTGIVLALAIGIVLAAVGVIVPGRQPSEYWPVNLALSAGVAYYIAGTGFTLPGWLPWAMAGGAFVHILGDMLTVEGCPLGWPTSDHNAHITPFPFRAGGPFERWVMMPLLVGLSLVLAADLAGLRPIPRIWSALMTVWSA